MTDLRLTNSEMTVWRRCKRKWYLSTYRGLRAREQEVTGHLSVGNIVHDALAEYYATGKDPTETVREAYALKIATHPAMEKDITKERDLCVAMTEGYTQWLEETGADADLKLVEAPEEAVEVPLYEGATLLSKLDARVERRSDGSRLALEHKTTGDLKAPIELHRLNTQFLTEHLVEFMSHLESKDKEVPRTDGVLVNMLRKVKRTAAAKPPFYGREEVPHNEHELRNHWRHVVAQAQEIQAARARLDAGEDHHTVAYPNPTRDCKWDCPFFRVCLLADDGSNFEGALEEMYTVGDPLERYSGKKYSAPGEED